MLTTAEIRVSGAVNVNECSGMLVTPYWVITAAHCFPFPGTRVALGNDLFAQDWTTTKVAEGGMYQHPGYPYSWEEVEAGEAGCHPFDVTLARLERPLFPDRGDGLAWERYRRDLYRSAISNLVGEAVDVYGVGCNVMGSPNCSGGGIMRLGVFEVEPNSTMLEFDGSSTYGTGDEQALKGDSGSAVLYPSQGWGTVVPSEEYTIAGISSCRAVSGPEIDNEAAPAPGFAGWFDATLGSYWGRFDAPSEIMSALLPLLN